MSHPTLIEIDRLLATAKFRHFTELLWPAVSSDRFVSGYHLDAICEHLQALAEGKLHRLAILVGVRHSKSLLCSVLFPAWLWVRQPSARIITGSYSQQLTVRDAVRTRQLLDSDLFKRYFPPISFTEDQARKDFYQNVQGGHRLSVSITSRTAGFDADYIVADDIMDMATRNSEAERNKAADYFETGLMSRFVNKSDERAVLAGHRIHEDDVYARLRAKYGDDGTWSWLVLPEEYTPKFSTWFNGIGWKDKRAEGELLWPERFDETVVAGEKKRYRHEYSAVFLQEPTPAEGTLFRPEWFRTWTEDTEPDGTPVYVLGGKRYAKSSAWRFATCDTAISTSAGADWTVCQVWDVVGPNLVLVDQLRKKLDGNRIVKALAEFVTLHQPQFVAVEKEFVGRFVIDQLRERDVVVKGFDARGQGDKETRAVAAEIKMEAGQVWFPSAPWVADLEKELLAFPNGSKDDQCDALSMGCLLSQKYRGKGDEVEPAEERQAREKKEADDRFRRLLWQGAPW